MFKMNILPLSLSFSVLCNRPLSYQVTEPSGSIRANLCADFIVRHKTIGEDRDQPPHGKETHTDKFRIQIMDPETDQVMARKDVLAITKKGLPDPSDSAAAGGASTHSLPHRRRPHGSSSASTPSPPYSNPGELLEVSPLPADAPQQPSLVACFTALVCIVSLYLPTEGDKAAGESIFADYPYLHLTCNQKLVFSFVLGLVTMAILRTTER